MEGSASWNARDVLRAPGTRSLAQNLRVATDRRCSKDVELTTFAPREIGRTGIFVTPLALGCWPIAGITSIDVHEDASLATIAAALDAGLNFFDTAYCYGYDGESERMVGHVLKPHRDRVVIATKGGIFWNADRKQVRDGRPATILRQADESLERLGIEQIDLHYLHAPDPSTPMAETATAFKRLLDAGKIRSVGVSNATTEQLTDFHAVCPISAFQPHYNMLQREIEALQLPWCVANDVSVMVYWPLMKGLLAGKLPRDHQFDPRDGRRKYPMFSGNEWDRNQDFLDQLRPIAVETGTTVAQVVLNWTIQRPGITVALCGAKRPDQIRDNAAALDWKLTSDQIARIDAAIAARGAIVSKSAV
jgi:aryl-alcohol dehydrogenase-like predicted oxidoreductase